MTFFIRVSPARRMKELSRSTVRPGSPAHVLKEAPVTPQTVDPHRAEQFAERVLGIINDAMLTLMISVGHRVRLFDRMAELRPSTSSAIAAAAGLNERYVREWLGAMVVGGIVEYQPDSRTYALPAEHAAALTRAAGTDNIAVQAQYVPLLAGVEKQIVACFENGGGVPYSEFGDFQTLMAEESAQVLDAALPEAILHLIDGMIGQARVGHRRGRCWLRVRARNQPDG